jgi:hypothetical protein
MRLQLGILALNRALRTSTQSPDVQVVDHMAHSNLYPPTATTPVHTHWNFKEKGTHGSRGRDSKSLVVRTGTISA